jgi:DNA-binding SARP family transcriptional activator
VERLVHSLWDGHPPPAGAARVRALVAEVRRALGPSGSHLLTTRRPGYVLNVGPDELDLLAFEGLIKDASRAATDADWPTAGRSAEQALALWRSDPLPDLPEATVREGERQRLGELHLLGCEAAFEAKIETGRHREVIAELLRLTAAHPLRERLHALQMRAPQQDGRIAEALELYTALRRRMVGELGVDPSDGIRALHQHLLRSGGTLGRQSTSPSPAHSVRRPVPRQLPPAPRRFVGRWDELDRLESCQHSKEPLALIVGPAGVGKTALALHWAHRVAESFPDGQLFLDMRGFDNGEPMTPEEALPLLLQGLGCAPRAIPRPCHHRHHASPHQSQRDLPLDAESRLTLYLAEHFDGCSTVLRH